MKLVIEVPDESVAATNLSKTELEAALAKSWITAGLATCLKHNVMALILVTSDEFRNEQEAKDMAKCIFETGQEATVGTLMGIAQSTGTTVPGLGMTVPGEMN